LPRKVARQKGYDVPFVGTGSATVALGMKETAAIRTALRRAPSQQFMLALSRLLSNYADHREAVTRSTPAAVWRRIKAVVDSTKTFQKTLSDLELTDIVHIDKFYTDRFLRGERRVGLNELAERLEFFLLMAEEALGAIAKEQKQGRMPAFAERALAKGLCQILFEETGEMPTTKKDGSFDRLLRFALDHVSERDRKDPRRDVTVLMHLALQQKPAPPHLLSRLGRTTRPALKGEK